MFERHVCISENYLFYRATGMTKVSSFINLKKLSVNVTKLLN